MSVTISTAGIVALGSFATFALVIFIIGIIYRIRLWFGYEEDEYK